MRHSPLPHPSPRLLPEGRRWGCGARSVMPYLSAAMQARPGDGEPAQDIRNPVFPQMELALRELIRRR